MMSQKLRIISLVLTLMLMASLAVLAADPSITSVNVSDPVDGLYTITAVYNDGSAGVSGKQVTMLIYKENETPSEDNIIGIDQLPSGDSGSVTFLMGTDSTTPAGIYTVLVGGEDLNSPTVASNTIVIGAAGGYTISGTATGLGNAPVTVTATIGGNTVEGITVDQGTGTYSIPAIADGSVVSISIAKKGHITYNKDITVSGDNVAKNVALIPGDTDNNGMIVLDDLMNVLNNWQAATIDETNTGADIDSNGMIVLDDLMAVLNYWQAAYTD